MKKKWRGDPERYLTAQQYDDIIRRYLAGERMGDLAREHKRSRQAISQALRRRGVKLRMRWDKV